jgi:tetratricopeptide (TPR) repeat protein
VLAVCVLLITMVFVVFGQTLHHEFVNYDDGQYFYSNSRVQTGLTWRGAQWALTTGYADNWFPLTWLSFMLDAELFGTGPVGPHLTNVLLHAANAVLLFLLLRRLTGAHWRSAFVAVVFAVHPLRVESVAWLVERKDVLSGLFFMLALLAYARYTKRVRESYSRNMLSYGLALLLFSFGLMSKPTVVTLPFVMLLLDWWPLGRLKSSTVLRLSLEKLPFLILSATSSVITFVVQQGPRSQMQTLPLASRIGNAAISYIVYLQQMFYPVGLAVIYPHPGTNLPVGEIITAAVIFAGISSAFFALRQQRPYLLVGWMWYVGMLVPMVGLVQVGFQARADRYTYLPQIGLYLLITWAATDVTASWRNQRRLLVAVALPLIAALMTCAAIQTSYWRNSESLWRHTLSCTSGNYLAYNNLGTALAERGRFVEAVEQYQKALQIKSDYTSAHSNLGAALLALGRAPEAIEHFQEAIAISPDAHSNLGYALQQAGRIQEAIVQYQEALRIAPDNVDTHNNLGNALAQIGRMADAIDQYEQVLRLKPDYALAHNNLGVLFQRQGRLSEAIAHYDRALKIRPDYVDAHYNLGMAMESQGRVADAIEQYTLTLHFNPNHEGARRQLHALGALPLQ